MTKNRFNLLQRVRKIGTTPKRALVSIGIMCCFATISISTLPVTATPAKGNAAGDKTSLTGEYLNKYQNVTDRLQIEHLSRNKIKFDLVALLQAGQETRNGEVHGIATLKGNTATYSDQDSCKVTIKFAANKAEIKVANADGCGFGAYVTADGSYRKISNRRPKFDF